MILTKHNINLLLLSNTFSNRKTSDDSSIPEIFGQFMIEPDDVLAIENECNLKGTSPYLYGESFDYFMENKADRNKELYEENDLDVVRINDPTIVWGIGNYYQKVG